MKLKKTYLFLTLSLLVIEIIIIANIYYPQQKHTIEFIGQKHDNIVNYYLTYPKQLLSDLNLNHLDLQNISGICYFNSLMILFYLDIDLVHFFNTTAFNSDSQPVSVIIKSALDILKTVKIDLTDHVIKLSDFVHNIQINGGNLFESLPELIEILYNENTITTQPNFFSKYKILNSYKVVCRKCKCVSFFKKDAYILFIPFNTTPTQDCAKVVEKYSIPNEWLCSNKACRVQLRRNNLHIDCTFAQIIIFSRIDKNIQKKCSRRKKDKYRFSESISIQNKEYILYAIEMVVYKKGVGHSYILYRNKKKWYSYDTGMHSIVELCDLIENGHYPITLFYKICV